MNMNLTSENVQHTFTSCLFAEGENTSSAVMVEGIKSDFGFHPERLKENTDKIQSMLAELPKESHESEGGGWSFLNACNNNQGIQWTDLHPVMEQLFCMGIAIGKAKYLMPREMWSIMPGQMPYLVVSS